MGFSDDLSKRVMRANKLRHSGCIFLKRLGKAAFAKELPKTSVP